MILYDDKTKGVIKSGNRIIIPDINVTDDVTFKASYIVIGDLSCSGKVSALFDLIVLGDFSAKEVDIKGRFVCVGQSSVDNEMIVQNDIWAESIRAMSIICHDRVVTQEVDVTSLAADGNVIVAKTLAVEEIAKTYQNVICGETAYGAGKIIANTIMTVEPIDLDDGEESLENPYVFKTENGSNDNSKLSKESMKYALNNDYGGFLDKLQLSPDPIMQSKFAKYKKLLISVDQAYPSSVSEFRDVALLIGLMELVNSEYFRDWEMPKKWLGAVKKHFENMAQGRLSNETEMKPATKLVKGYVVSHFKYGRGIVTEIKNTVVMGKRSQSATVLFDDYGEKKFPLPNALSFFMVIKESAIGSPEEVKAFIQCNINSYTEWLSALTVINDNKEYLGKELYTIVYDLLLGKLGLKSRFVESRFKAKGWS